MKISIDGNLGSGKSTLMSNLEKHYDNFDNPGILFTQEPVKIWQPYLNNFYNDMKNSSLALQMKILKHHIQVPSGNNNLISLTERSATSCIDIFGKYLLNKGLLNSLDIDLMKDYDNSFGSHPDMYIYIKTNASICANRINLRNRESEDSISFDYIESIDNLYNERYCNNIDKSKNYYIIDGSKNEKEVLKDTVSIIDYSLQNLS
tara:strand:- start:2683 stop:3297 length:615 start_codon:yes stop_codon:yes gene_type:complete